MADVPQLALYALAAMAVFGIALHAFVLRRHLVRRVIAVNLMGSAVFLLLVAIARRVPDGPPDPVPHAMVLTGIVVAVSASAFALILMRRIHDATGSAELPDTPPGDPPGPASSTRRDERTP